MLHLRGTYRNCRSVVNFVEAGNGARRTSSCSFPSSTGRRCVALSGVSTTRTQTQCRHVHSVSTVQQKTQLKEKISVNFAKLSSNGEYLVVILENRSTIEFPTVWLRDNCQCSKCFNPALNSRTIDWQTFDINIKPTSLKMNGDFVDVVWSDNHRSSFDVDWLKNRRFEADQQQQWLHDTYRPPKIPWTSREYSTACKRFNFDDIINTDDGLLLWLESVARHGVAIVEGVPSRPDQNRLLANRMAFIKKTHYGEEFEVRGKPDTSNLAYLPIPLQLHTDLPYYEYKPGLNMLHCLVQTKGEGGENQLTDCLNISNILKETDPETYDILTTTMVEWDDIGEDLEGRFYSLYRAPVLCLDRSGRFERVNYSQQQRSSHFNVPLEKVVPWYKAHKKFTNLLHDPDNTVFFKTQPGEILTFDNVRMVHGRKGYTDVEGNERHLIGVYIDWDIAYSKMRILKRDKDPGKYL